MQNEKLIEAVRIREFLYNLQHPKYMDAKYKNISWREIAEELDMPVAECKKRWSNMRDSFRKFRGRENATRSGQGADETTVRPYKYGRMMEFLIPFMQERRTVSSLPDSLVQEEEASMSTSQEATTSAENGNDSHCESAEEEQERRKSNKRKRVNSALPELIAAIKNSADVMQQLIANEQSQQIQFYKDIALTLGRLAPKRQRIAKEKILAIAKELEEEEERENSENNE